MATSIENRIGRCTTDGAKNTQFFDIEDTFRLLSGHRGLNGKVILKEGELEEHGVDSFKVFFAEVCKLQSIQKLGDPSFDSRMASSVLHNWKKSLRKLVWEKDLTQALLSCLLPANDNKIHKELLTDFNTFLNQVEPVDADERKLQHQQVFRFQFANHSSFEAYVDEEAVVKILYTNSLVYEEAGPIAMTAFDIAMSMGGSEAICESFYSVMNTQKQMGQHNSTLEDRTLVDWSTSNVLSSENIIAEAAKLYVNGDTTLR